MSRLLIFFFLLASHTFAQTVMLSGAQALAIGKRIWKNECAGSVSGLTSWNRGEDFASLGIGHFIWYPVGKRGPFEESFPALVAYLVENGTQVPAWLRGECPWSTRAAFMADFGSSRMKQLRSLLADTVGWQAKFCAQRLELALPKILAAAPRNERERIRTHFYRVAAAPLGMYALIDYVNFKGEGVNPSERYKDQGWGLLQVLESMREGAPLPAFATAADRVLTRRVKNSPKSRNEAQWLLGWRNRIATYTK